MSSRTRSRKQASIGSNHSLRRPTPISASEPRTGNFVLLLVMAWSPPAHNAGNVRVSAPGDYATFNSNHTPDGTIAEHAIFLATDDAEAADEFKRAFGPRLIVRSDVQRTTSDAAEVHFRDWDRLSISDAEDVVVDTVLLSKCDVPVHASSSVSTIASIMNPALTLVRV